MSRQTHVSVIGGGSWGTTVASLAARNAPTTLWTRREEEIVHLVADEMKNHEIAQKLKVKEHSIRKYFIGFLRNSESRPGSN